MGRIKMVAVAALFPLVLAACSNGEENGAGTDAQPEESADATVAVEDSDLGQIVVDAEGKTLYVFLADEGSDSTCYDDCEAAWPPLTVEGIAPRDDGARGRLHAGDARRSPALPLRVRRDRGRHQRPGSGRRVVRRVAGGRGDPSVGPPG